MSHRKKKQNRNHRRARQAGPESSSPAVPPSGRSSVPLDLQEMEFHRNGIALVPDPRDQAQAVAYWIRSDRSAEDVRRCSCPAFRRETCPHVRRLMTVYQAFLSTDGGHPPDQAFRASAWHAIGRILGETGDAPLDSVRLEVLNRLGGGQVVMVKSAGGRKLAEYLSQEPDALRLVDRLRGSREGKAPLSRGALLHTLAAMTLSEEERVYAARGYQSRGQAMEQSFWYRLAYHGFREFGENGVTFHAAVEEASGAFTVTCRTNGEVPRVRMIIPGDRVRPLLTALGDLLPNQHGLRIHPIPLRSIFRISLNTQTDRVHRFGQKRGVQVFKLVTEGTLEEKISAMIERKRGLLDEIVQEDDPGLLKSFSRDELLQFLAAPV